MNIEEIREARANLKIYEHQMKHVNAAWFMAHNNKIVDKALRLVEKLMSEPSEEMIKRIEDEGMGYDLVDYVEYMKPYDCIEAVVSQAIKEVEASNETLEVEDE